MTLPTRVICVASLAILSFSCITENLEQELNTTTIDYIVPETKLIEVEILDRINSHRSSKGLNTLDILGIIKSQAYSHTDYMIDQDNISHDYFHARKLYLINYANASKVSENVAYGYNSAESVVNAWLNSDSHRQAIEGNYSNFDISAERDEDGFWYFTNIFVQK